MRRLLVVVALGAFTLSLGACSSTNSIDDVTGQGTTLGTPVAPAALSGMVVDGPVSGGSVRLYHVQPDGNLGEPATGAHSYPLPPPQELARVQASDQGSFRIPLNDTAPLMVEAFGGKHLDLASGQTRSLPPGFQLRAAVPDPGAGPVVVTPLTTLAAHLALAQIRAGRPVQAAMTDANQAVSRFFGLGDVLHTVPGTPGSPQASDYLALLGGLSQLALKNNLDLSSLILGLAHDIEDGKLDGKAQATPLKILTHGSFARDRIEALVASPSPSPTPQPTCAPSSQSALSSTAATSDLVAATQGGLSSTTAAALSSSDGTVASAPAGYVSPYTITFTNPISLLNFDFNTAPRGVVSAESNNPPFASWYDCAAYPDSPGSDPNQNREFGPEPARYPAPSPPAGANANWARERIVATAMQYIGYNYQHHHIPDWAPTSATWPFWLTVSLGHNSPGIDCSDFSGWYYNYGLGIQLNTGVSTQAGETSVQGPQGTINVTTLLQATSTNTTDYATINATLQTGDLLYIRGETSNPPGAASCSHVIMWIGSLGSGNVPLILDSHDNKPPVQDSNGVVVPAGVHLRPFVQGSWYHVAFDHAHRILP